MKITKKQIKELSQINRHTECWCKKNFPKAFETVLEVGKWYKSSLSAIVFNNGKEYLPGFSDHVWIENLIELEVIKSIEYNHFWTEATEAEVFEALKNEAIKRYKIGDTVLSAAGGTTTNTIRRFDFNYYMTLNNLVSDYESPTDTSISLFNKGKWAEIIQTITKAEAEKELNKKIID